MVSISLPSLRWPHLALLQPVYTDAYLWDRESLDEIEEFLECVLKIAKAEPHMPSKWELVLDPVDDRHDGKHVWYYYFVNPQNRACFGSTTSM